jgi:hypothetical protein
MNSHQGNILADVSHDQGDGILTTLAAIQDLVLKPNDLEFAPFRGELGSGHNLEDSRFCMVIHGLQLGLKRTTLLPFADIGTGQSFLLTT